MWDWIKMIKIIGTLLAAVALIVGATWQVAKSLSSLEQKIAELEIEVKGIKKALDGAPAEGPSRPRPTAGPAAPSDALEIKFSGFYPFGEIEVQPSPNRRTFSVRGQSEGYSGYTKASSFPIGKRRALMVSVQGSKDSKFTNANKMLKVTVGLQDIGLRPKANEFISDDPEFLYKTDGTFSYTLPERLVINDSLEKIGFVFGPGEIKDIVIEAWFQ